MKKNSLKALVIIGSIISMNTVIFADTLDNDNGVGEVAVYASYAGAKTTETVYKVDIEWGNMEFTYNSNSTQTWNPDTHKYEINIGTPTWKCDSEQGNRIKITNHSNAAITAHLFYNPEEGSKVSGTFDNSELVIDTAENTAVDNAPHKWAALSLDGELSAVAVEKTRIGTITVSIAK